MRNGDFISGFIIGGIMLGVVIAIFLEDFNPLWYRKMAIRLKIRRNKVDGFKSVVFSSQSPTIEKWMFKKYNCTKKDYHITVHLEGE